ncbi:hypothetical protein LCGC14_2129900, partial [marine sediment metagenome]
EEIIIPDVITSIDLNTVTIDLNSFAPISGTWHASASGGAFDANVLANDFVRNSVFNAAFPVADANLVENYLKVSDYNVSTLVGGSFGIGNYVFPTDVTIGNNLIVNDFIGIPADTDLLQLLNGELDIEGDLLVIGTAFATIFDGPLVRGNITIDNSLEGQLDFTASGGADDTDLAFDLDGTRPRIFSTTDNTIEIAESVIIIGTLDVRGGVIEDTQSEDLVLRTNNVPNQLLLDLSGRIGIGTATPSVLLDVIGDFNTFTANIDGNLNVNQLTYSWSGVRGTNGQVLTEDGLGNLSWTTISGGGVSDQNIYSLGIMSIDTNAFLIDLNTVANLIVDLNFNWANLTYKGPTSRGTNGQVLTEDGIGNLSWTSVAG